MFLTVNFSLGRPIRKASLSSIISLFPLPWLLLLSLKALYFQPGCHLLMFYCSRFTIGCHTCACVSHKAYDLWKIAGVHAWVLRDDGQRVSGVYWQNRHTHPKCNDGCHWVCGYLSMDHTSESLCSFPSTPSLLSNHSISLKPFRP